MLIIYNYIYYIATINKIRGHEFEREQRGVYERHWWEEREVEMI